MRVLDVLDGLVDDAVQADVHLLALGRISRTLPSGRTLKPMMMAFEAEASMTSVSVIAPTPP